MHFGETNYTFIYGYEQIPIWRQSSSGNIESALYR